MADVAAPPFSTLYWTTMPVGPPPPPPPAPEDADELEAEDELDAADELDDASDPLDTPPAPPAPPEPVPLPALVLASWGSPVSPSAQLATMSVDINKSATCFLCALVCAGAWRTCRSRLAQVL